MNTTPLFIARRIGLGHNNFSRRSSTGIVVAVTGIALSIVIMMASMAVMNGFKDEIKRKVTGFGAQLTIQLPPPASDMSTEAGSTSLTPQPLSINPTVTRAITELRDNGFDVTYWLVSLRPVIIKTSDNFKGAVAKGVSDPKGSDFLSQHIIDGSMPDYTDEKSRNSIVVSRAIATELSLKCGDRIQAYFFGDDAVKVRNLTIEGIYDTYFSDYDKTFVYTSLKLLQSVDRLNDDEGTRVELNGLDDGDVDNAAAVLQGALLNELYTGRDSIIYQVDNVHHRGAHYFNWLDLLDTNVTVILLLMALVAGFTLISSLFIIILERVNMIGILKALGASDSFIRRIFITIAERIVLRGMLIGNLLALTIIWIQYTFHPLPLDPETYYLSYVPVEITVPDIIWLNIGVIVVSLAVLILPSQIISKISPARSIRYE